MRSTLSLALFPMAAVVAMNDVAVELDGSPASMERQHEIATGQELRFAETPADVGAQVDAGRLVPVRGNRDYWVKTKRGRHALPEVRRFIERLAAQYHETTGRRLVVTSLTRPASRQPSNAHRLSVHPAGMAVDLRVPRNEPGLAWMQGALLSLERAGVLDATREYYPPHFHVAVFPEAYAAYAEERMLAEAEARVAERRAEAARGGERSDPAGAATTVSTLAGLAAFGVWRRRRV